MVDFYRSRLRLFGFRVSELPVHRDSRLPSLIKPGPLLMHVIFHRKDSCVCVCVHARVYMCMGGEGIIPLA